ncbi:uncharacterized protein EI97DRAFT_370485 [Westerdykella ornata]|uniref:NlpC/P60 domain-containing protein n=1 Tax=Westerdykella ornata TaxID=318751 RepID=A0A6A6JSZ9_WESOR|nr:uncharacterized protein EI97DRAFT_370485 [Westerdykella ornata]KAF2279364.1 hypothetical protein EI97DRAFT_370485 [Westerdykella ornata]
MLRTIITALAISSTAVNATAIHAHQTVVNGPCTGANGVKGVCVSTGSCASDGGTYITGACPGTPDNIKCCTKPSCQRGSQSGACRWTDECAGTVLTGLCPGPSTFRCCLSGEAPPSGPNLGEKVLRKAKEAEGIPYQWGGGNCKGPTGGGFDCSGLVSWALCQVTGRDLFAEGLRVTREMYCASEAKLKYKKVSWAQRRAGDAVFFGGSPSDENRCNCNTDRQGIHHVGLMMDSGWTMWNALKTGTKIRKDNFRNWDEAPCPYVIRF